MEYQYDVFLSYRHRPLDAAVTARVFHLLESYKLPKPLLKQGFSGIRRVFRDTEELAVSRILSNTIEEALRGTRCLVVVCSPDTPSSEWVDREVATFIELGRAEKIFPLLISGDSDVSFPSSLKKIPDIEARILDVRAPQDRVKKILWAASDALLRVAAEVSGCHHADLVRRHKLRKTRRAFALRAGIAALFAGIGIVSGLFWMAAENYRDRSLKEQAASMAILQDLTYSLPDKMVELPGVHRAVAQILKDNAEQILRILEFAEDKEAIAPEIASNYEKLATASLTLGYADQSADAQREAIEIYQTLYEKGSSDILPALASAWNNLGIAFDADGAFSAAQEAYETAIRHQAASEDQRFDARLQLAAFHDNLAVNRLRQGDDAGALPLFAEAGALLSALWEESPARVGGILSVNCNNYGTCLYRLGRYAEAEPLLLRSIALAQDIFDATPNRTNLALLVRPQSSLANCYTLQAKFEEALGCFGPAMEAQSLLAEDEENLETQTALAALYNNYGMCLNMTGDYREASFAYRKNVEILEKTFSVQPSPPSQALLARACYNVAENAFKAGEYMLSRTYYDRCLALYAPVAETLGVYHRGEYLARLAYYQIIFEQDYAVALANAAAAADLQPDSSFVFYVFGYALLYNDLTEACDQVFTALAARSEGEAVNIRLDFEALTRFGLSHSHMEHVLTLIGRG